ncbi:hypothetical protein POX_b02525 [Penicillium oxalicum]|uniref:hypothetical protein n=1 Tax=Penicillium oxalicum TaxID=69781 RepID=UPI0020B6DDD5|nr:hypothetical protein POX_b02525 [Penicillium oxalicum]KAI2792487.1 hypothetical protein POX_b02525 [Penicillium oxalicum]
MSLLGKKFPGLLGMLESGNPSSDLNRSASPPGRSIGPCLTNGIQLSAGPMTPFFAAGVIVLYGVNSLQNALSNTAEFKNDPRNPNAKGGNSH